MKHIVLTVMLSTLLGACHAASEESPDLTQIRIKNKPCEKLKYVGRIGSNLDTAIESLRGRKNISSSIAQVPLEVLFDYDSRSFFGIVYGDCAMYSDVLDTEGNWYLRSWNCSDEDRSAAGMESPPSQESLQTAYDLQGRRRMRQPGKGITIHGYKKVLADGH